MSELDSSKVVSLNKLFEVNYFDPKLEIELPAVPKFLQHRIPKAKRNYCWDKSLLRKINLWDQGLAGDDEDVSSHGITLMLLGDPGSGKSSALAQYAALMRRPLFKTPCHGAVKYEDLEGDYMLASDVRSMDPDEMDAMGIPTGKFAWLHKAFYALVDAVKDVAKMQPRMLFRHREMMLAMKYGGIFMGDEGNTLHPEVFLWAHGICDGQPHTITRTGEIINPHPDFRLCFTGNGGMHGDTVGVFKQVKTQNGATRRRIMPVRVNYPDEAALTNLVNVSVVDGQGAPALSAPVVNAMVRTVIETRELYIGSSSGKGDMLDVLTTDILLRWAKLADIYMDLAVTDKSIINPVIEALDFANLDLWQERDAIVVKDMFKKVIGITE